MLSRGDLVILVSDNEKKGAPQKGDVCKIDCIISEGYDCLKFGSHYVTVPVYKIVSDKGSTWTVEANLQKVFDG